MKWAVVIVAVCALCMACNGVGDMPGVDDAGRNNAPSGSDGGGVVITVADTAWLEPNYQHF